MKYLEPGSGSLFDRFARFFNKRSGKNRAKEILYYDCLTAMTPHSYTYDELDRLKKADGVGANGYSQDYEYDRIGNITRKSDVGYYVYDYGNKPHAVRSAGNMSFDYDLNGNMTRKVITGGERLDMDWSYDNKPTLIKKDGANHIELFYDGHGQRVRKFNYSTGRSVLYFGEGYEVRGDVEVFHLFAGKNRVASIRSDGNDQFYHHNHLGSASVITDQHGEMKEKIEYFPFGTYRERPDYDQGFPNVNYTFTDQEDDDELGFYNYDARLYDPLIGRFISADTIVPEYKDPQSLNRYSYVKNNPLRYTDPTGHQEEEGKEGEDQSTEDQSTVVAAVPPIGPAPDRGPLPEDILDIFASILNSLKGLWNSILSSIQNSININIDPKANVPQKALDTLNYVREHKGSPPPGHKGGATWDNKHKDLPPEGKYKEYDVDPRKKGIPRNAERLVADESTGRAWYTPDHYKNLKLDTLLRMI